MPSQRNIVWVLVVVAVTTMFYGLTPMVAEQDSVYRTYAPLVEVDALIRREYVTPERSRQLVDGAIRGMLLELDRYSGYVPPEDMETFQFRHTGDYVGIGVEVGMIDGMLAVIAPIEEGPAARAGIESGDAILSIDGRATDEMSVFEAEGLFAGRQGTSITLRIQRATGRAESITVTRAPVKRLSVKGFSRNKDASWNYFADRDRKIAYIRISRFSEGVTLALDDAIRQAIELNATGLILDLRFNPGGLLSQAVETADRFLDSGVIVSTVTRQKAVATYTATEATLAKKLPLIVLINGFSASSSEIVAGALQARGRASVIGERSFGKGSVQNLIMIQHGQAGLKLTVAYYQLPNGHVVHKTTANADTDDWGVIPDITIPMTKAEYDNILISRSAVDSNRQSPAAQTDATVGNSLPTLIIDRQLESAIDALSPKTSN